MFYISAITSSGKCYVTDTSDGVSELYTKEELVKCRASLKRNIAGLFVKDGKCVKAIALTHPCGLLIDELKRVERYLDCDWDMESDKFSVRDWGTWVVPNDFAHEFSDADEDDFDWKTLSEDSFNRLKTIINDFYKKYAFQFTFEIGEKSYIYFSERITG